MMPFITMLNKAIRLSNEVFGTNFDTIDVSWDFDMANAIQEKIDEYVTVIDAYNSMTGQGAYDAGNIPTGADLGIDNFDYLNEETTKQTQLLAEQKASLDNLSGGANLQDIADLTAESNRLLEDAKQNKIDTQNIVDNSVNNINISANEVGADLLDRNALERLLDDYFKKKNQQTGVSMGY
jgi:hypothetical protein